METAALPSSPPVDASPLRLALVFALLFIAYQLPEGLGMRTLDSFPVQAALMLAFPRSHGWPGARSVTAASTPGTWG